MVTNNKNYNRDEYRPTKSDIDWTKSLIETLNDNGVWIVPMTGGIYRISHKQKTLEFIEGNLDQTMHTAITCNFNQLGYKVKP